MCYIKKVIIIILAVCFFVGIAGCGGEAPTKKSGYTTEGKTTALVPDEKLKGSLTVNLFKPDYNQQITGIDFGDLLTKATAKFKELYPNCELILERCNPGEDLEAFTKKLYTKIMAGKDEYV